MTKPEPAGQQSVIGFLGVGSAIGRPMAERLVKGGVKMVVYNRTAAATDPFKGCAEIAATPAQAADMADFIFACLAPDAYHDVVLGPQGVIRGARVKTYVHLGTNDVALVEELASALGGCGVAMLDAPITGGVTGAIMGELTVMASGPREAFDRTEPHLRHYADKIVYLGERVGAAQVMKLINNTLSAANLAVACEALVLGRKAGLDPFAMLDVLNSGTGQNNATLTKIPSQILTRAFNQGVTVGAMIEIVESFLGEARLQGISIPLAEAVIATLRVAAAEEGEKADLTTVIRPMERMAGVTVG